MNAEDDDEETQVTLDKAALVVGAQMLLGQGRESKQPLLMLRLFIPGNQTAILILQTNVIEGLIEDLPAFYELYKRMLEGGTIN
jgi:hypothetical protein